MTDPLPLTITMRAPGRYMSMNDRATLRYNGGTSDPGATAIARDLIPTLTGGRNMTEPTVSVVPARNRPRVSRGVPAATFARLMQIETDECIIWPHAKSARGYGSLSVNGQTRKVYVLSCELRHGPRPAGMEAAHSCGIPACMNYRHLRWATPSQNHMDRVTHGVSNRGERCGAAKLTEADVLEIRRLSVAGVSQTALAAEFGVTQPNIHCILSGKSWGWLPS